MGVHWDVQWSIQARDCLCVEYDSGSAGLGASLGKLTAVHVLKRQFPTSPLILALEYFDHEEAGCTIHVKHAQRCSPGIKQAAFISRNDVLEVPRLKARVGQHVGFELVNHVHPWRTVALEMIRQR